MPQPFLLLLLLPPRQCFTFLGAASSITTPYTAVLGCLSSSVTVCGCPRAQPSHPCTCTSPASSSPAGAVPPASPDVTKHWVLPTLRPRTPPGSEVSTASSIRVQMLADTSQGNWYSGPFPRPQASPRLWGVPATCQASAPSLPSSCCRMAAQPSLLTGIFQLQKLPEPPAARTPWPGAEHRTKQGCGAGRVLTGAAPTGPHRSPSEAHVQGE